MPTDKEPDVVGVVRSWLSEPQNAGKECVKMSRTALENALASWPAQKESIERQAKIEVLRKYIDKTLPGSPLWLGMDAELAALNAENAQ